MSRRKNVCATQRWEKGGKIKEDLAQPIFLHFAVFLVHFLQLELFKDQIHKISGILDGFGVV
jgi:hypothetical protein